MLTTNEDGVLYEQTETYSNEGGIVFEQDTIHENEGGVLYEIFAAWKPPDMIEWDFPSGTVITTNNGYDCDLAVEVASGGYTGTVAFTTSKNTNITINLENYGTSGPEISSAVILNEPDASISKQSNKIILENLSKGRHILNITVTGGLLYQFSVTVEKIIVGG